MGTPAEQGRGAAREPARGGREFPSHARGVRPAPATDGSLARDGVSRSHVSGRTLAPADVIAFTLLGQAASKANRRRFAKFGDRIASIKSPEALAFERDALRQIPAWAR